MTKRLDRPANWLHDRYSFFKYTTRDAALSVLNNRSLRWSSPYIFNDPFDMQFDLQINADAAGIRQRTLDALWNAHYSRDGIPVGNLLGHVIKTFKTRFPKLSRDDFNREFGQALDESLRARSGFSEMNAKLKELISDTKILCLSESYDSILMWSHYADMHRGAVLEIACLPEVDSVWGIALPVFYSENMPQMFDDEFLIRMLSGQSEIDPHDILKKFVTAKAKDWSYEREWRVILHCTDPHQLTQDIRFTRKELAAVYFGCRMEKGDKETLATKIGKDYPGTKVFEAEKIEHTFALRFREV